MSIMMERDFQEFKQKNKKKLENRKDNELS